MIFSSIEYIIFILILCILFYNTRRRLLILLIGSIFFYSFWKIENLPLLLFSIVLNYLIGNVIVITKNKFYTFIGITINILLLFHFKYALYTLNLFNSEFENNSSFLNKLFINSFPLGISFFTFQQIAYLVDCYKNKNIKCNIVEYSLFVSFFPQLIAGPIIQQWQLIPQLKYKIQKRIDFKEIYVGIARFSIGLFKKIMIADSLGIHADKVFGHYATTTESIMWWQILIGVLCYTMQLYFDFSAYSDMAIGVAKIFKIKLPENFNSPYKSQSVKEFWKRWHITLSFFFQKYLYIPLGGNRNGKLKKYRNVIVTMSLCGVWHGVGAQYLLWGLYHGVLLTLHDSFRKLNKINSIKCINIFTTFTLISFGWILFRAENLDIAYKMYFDLITFCEGDNLQILENKKSIISLTIGFIIVFLLPNSSKFQSYANSRKKISFPFFILIFSFLTVSLFKIIYIVDKDQPFLYFEF